MKWLNEYQWLHSISILYFFFILVTLLEDLTEFGGGNFFPKILKDSSDSN